MNPKTIRLRDQHGHFIKATSEVQIIALTDAQREAAHQAALAPLYQQLSHAKNRHERRDIRRAIENVHADYRTECEIAQYEIMRAHNRTAVLPSEQDVGMVTRWHLQRKMREARALRLAREFEQNTKQRSVKQ